jgi:hypothetical protein
VTFSLASLIAPQFAPASQTTMYTAPNSTIVRVDALTITNIDTVPRTISINLVTFGGAAGSSNLTTKAQAVPPGKSWLSPNEAGKVLNPGDFLSVIASSASALVISAAGVVQS